MDHNPGFILTSKLQRKSLAVVWQLGGEGLQHIQVSSLLISGVFLLTCIYVFTAK